MLQLKLQMKSLNGRSEYNRDNMSATIQFCMMFDRFFDCLNSRSLDEAQRRKKPDIDAHRSQQDYRFQVRSTLVCTKVIATITKNF